MNLVFFGSSQFAVPSLEALITGGYNISCVVTQPDRQKGRGLHLESTAVKNTSLEAGLRIYQPENINTSESIKFLKSLNPDLFVVISYGQILSQRILEIPKLFAINAHASLLPKYRGAAPINWAIIRGEKISGVTIIKMTEKMDAGPIIAQETVGIEEEDNAVTLENKLSQVTAEVLINALKSIKDNAYRLTAQDESKATFAPKLKKEDGLIYWDKSAEEIYNLIKGCSGWPGAFTYYQGKILKIWKAGVIPRLGSTSLATNRLGQATSPGEVVLVAKDGIEVAAGEGILVIQELQIEGKRKMTVEEFIAGHKILVGEILGKK